MNEEQELKELEKAGIKFRSETDIALDDLKVTSSRTEILEVDNAPKPQPRCTPEELRQRAEQQEKEEQKKEVKRQIRLAQSREIRAERWQSTVPQVWRDANLDLLAPNIAQACQRWIDRPDDKKWSLVFLGATGVGKTFTMYCVARELWIDRYDTEIVDVKVLMDSIRPNSDETGRMFERFKNVEVLFLDDLGSEKMSDWTTERLDLIINYRWERQMATVVSTNVSAADLKVLFGERFTSRLFGDAVIVKIAGKDRRLNS